MTATVILPTTGAPELKDAIESVYNQTYQTQLYLVVDGPDHFEKVSKIIVSVENVEEHLRPKICILPLNVGANGFYGHRVYAAFTHLINTKYVLYLDQDCWFERNHVESLVKIIEDDNLDWAYSLRNIREPDGEFACQDDCESLGPKWPLMGYPHVDTNCYCIKTEIAIKVSSAWHGGWGQDRVFLNTLSHHFNKFDCSGQYTVNYRMGGGTNAVKSDFFKNNNSLVKKHYNGELPWRKS